jgi:hypothetical protein
MVQAAKELTSAEWSRLSAARRAATEAPEELARLEERLSVRRSELVARSVHQAVDRQGARIASVEVSRGGTIAGVHISPQYRVSGYLAETPRLHVRVTLDRPITGPIAIGRGRHVGFGLLWPAEDRDEPRSVGADGSGAGDTDGTLLERVRGRGNLFDRFAEGGRTRFLTLGQRSGKLGRPPSR